MAQITIKLCNTGETISIDDISLGNITGEYLISELISNGLITRYLTTEIGKCPEYYIIYNNIPLINSSLTLEELGVRDGDVISVAGKPNGTIK